MVCALCVRQSVSQSVCHTFLNPAITLKVLNIFFIKLETWIDGNKDIMHVISFCSYVKNSGFYGNK